MRENYPLQIYVNGSERMRITSGGDVLVSKTAAGTGTVGVEARSDGLLAATRDGNQPLLLNRKTSDGNIALFQKDGTTVGTVRSEGGDIVFGNDTRGLKFRDADVIPRDMDNTTADGVVSLGSSTSRFQDLYLSGGAYLGGTAAANHLDDYEEGSWTPTLRFGGSTTGISYSSQQGRYTKIGNTVHVQVFIALSSKGSASGDADIDGLPFNQSGPGFHCFGINVFNWASGTNYPIGQTNGNDDVVQFKQLGTDTSFTNTAFSNTTGIRMSFMYVTG